MDASPTKRRALGSLDANASPRPRMSGKQHDSSYPPHHSSPMKRLAVFPSASELSPKKRLVATEAAHALGLEPMAKKVCRESGREELHVDQENQMQSSQSSLLRQQSFSPEPSSVFDSSAIDTSQATVVTEPDIIAPSAAVSALNPSASASNLIPTARLSTRPRLTREQAREKAEIIRLRLGLASYKVRTGQTDVPLETLERKRAVSMAARNRNAEWAVSSRLQMQASAALAGVHHRRGASTDAAAGGRRRAAPPSTRRPLPGAPVRRPSGDSTTSQRSSSNDGREDATHGGDAHRRRSSDLEDQARDGGARLLPGQTPRRLLRFEVEVDDEGSSSRGGAASGLLSLARS